MRRLAENCNICGKSVSRFQAHNMICHRCKEVICRQCTVDPAKLKTLKKTCRKCEGAYN
ncbi:MAG: hypothetical protein H8E38_01015 [SAR324 cluster bacterium]|nr:hypothetical protein [SAR324 cluster bacterium]